MAINWGRGWYFYSEAKGKPGRHESAEKATVKAMIEKSASSEVRRYAASLDGGDVYVKNGIHVSSSEKRRHVTVTLGYGKEPWTSPEWPGATAHIMVEQTHDGMHATDLFKNLPKDSQEKIAKITLGHTPPPDLTAVPTADVVSTATSSATSSTADVI